MIVMGSMDMDRNSYEVLCEIHSDMKKELEKHLAELAEKRKRIEEIDSYMNGLLSKEENDLQVFLPRRVENLYRDDIEQCRKEREKLILECDSLQGYIQSEYEKVERLDKLKFDLLKMLHVKQFSTLNVSSLQILSRLIPEIRSVSDNMEVEDGDMIKAKQVLSGIEQDIGTVIADAKDLIFHRNLLSSELNLLSDEVSLNDMLSEYFDALHLNRSFCIKADIDDIRIDHSDFAREIAFVAAYRIIVEYINDFVSYSDDHRITIKVKKQKYKYWIVIKDNKGRYDRKEDNAPDHIGIDYSDIVEDNVKNNLKADQVDAGAGYSDNEGDSDCIGDTASGLDAIKKIVFALGGNIDIRMSREFTIDIKIPDLV